MTSPIVVSATAFVVIVSPLRMIVTRSHSSKTSSRRWETYTIATPSSRRDRRTVKTSRISVSVREAVGSSRISTRASVARARATATMVCCTGERSPASLRIDIFWFRRSSCARASRRSARPSTIPKRLGSCSPSRTFSATRRGRHDRELLVERHDAGLVRGAHVGEFDVLATAADLTGVGGVQACHHLDERGLAGAVLAEQRMDLTGLHREPDALERMDPVEALDDVDGFERGLLGERGPLRREGHECTAASARSLQRRTTLG